MNIYGVAKQNEWTAILYAINSPVEIAENNFPKYPLVA